MRRNNRYPRAMGLLLGLSLTSGSGRPGNMIKHDDQSHLNEFVDNGQGALAFEQAFETDDEISEFRVIAEQGVGANIEEGRRFARLPRVDLKGPGEWATHLAGREGGADAGRRVSCRSKPIAKDDSG